MRLASISDYWSRSAPSNAVISPSLRGYDEVPVDQRFDCSADIDIRLDHLCPLQREAGLKDRLLLLLPNPGVREVGAPEQLLCDHIFMQFRRGYE